MAEERRELSGDALKAELANPVKLLCAQDSCFLEAQILETIAALLAPAALTSVGRREEGRVVENVSTYSVDWDDKDGRIEVTSRKSDSGYEFTVRFTTTSKSPKKSAQR